VQQTPPEGNAKLNRGEQKPCQNPLSEDVNNAYRADFLFTPQIWQRIGLKKNFSGPRTKQERKTLSLCQKSGRNRRKTLPVMTNRRDIENSEL
jgi:hypothetical protein